MKYTKGDRVTLLSAQEMRQVNRESRVFGGLTEEMVDQAGRTFVIREYDTDCKKHGRESYHLEGIGFTWDVRLFKQDERFALSEELFEL